MSLKKINFERLKRDIEKARILLLLLTDAYIDAMKNPENIEHLALSYQLSEAAKGEKEVYIVAVRPLSRDNFDLAMDLLEGSKLKAVIFIDRDNKEDMEKMSTLLHILMGPFVRVSGSSRDSGVYGQV